MRPIRDAVCLIVAVGSIALAAWQPVIGADRNEEAKAGPAAGVAKQVDERVPRTLERAMPSAPLLKA